MRSTCVRDTISHSPFVKSMVLPWKRRAFSVIRAHPPAGDILPLINPLEYYGHKAKRALPLINQRASWERKMCIWRKALKFSPSYLAATSFRYLTAARSTRRFISRKSREISLPETFSVQMEECALRGRGMRRWRWQSVARPFVLSHSILGEVKTLAQLISSH